MDGGFDMPLDIFRKAGVDLVQDVGAVPQRPHLAHRFIAHPGDHAANIIHHRIHRDALVHPVLLLPGQFQADRVALAVFEVGHRVAGRLRMRHIVDPRPDVDQRLKLRVPGDVVNPFAVHIDFTVVTQ